MADSDPPVYPIYLDSDMVVSLLAAIEGGVSFEKALTTKVGETRGFDVEAGATVGATGLLSRVLSASVHGSTSGSRDDTSETVTGLVRRETEASLLNQLRRSLDAARLIVRGREITRASPGSFIETEGRLQRSLLGGIAKAIQRWQGRFEPVVTGRSPSARGNRRQVTAPKTPEDLQNEQGLRFLMSLRDDLDDEPFEDTAFWPVDNAPPIVALLRRAITNEQTLGSLQFGRFRLLGKVSDVHPVDEEVHLLRRSFAAYVPGDSLETSLEEVLNSGSIQLGPLTTRMKGGVVEVFPLAIYV